MRMTPHYPDNGRLLAGMALLAIMILAVSGCGEPLNVYKVSDRSVDPGSRVLVLPFMDTRTFVDPRDPYKDGLGNHARDIFVSAMREHPMAGDCDIIAPELVRPEGSMTIAEVADLGRLHGADFVVSGQVFSFTGTRAASIPPRAGMFIRIVSAHDGSLVFVGDHYQSAPIPGAPGGRELQARAVSDRLVEGFVAGVDADALARRFFRSARSTKAMASFGEFDTRVVDGEEYELPPLPPLPVVFNGEPDDDAWAEMEAPAIPVVLDYDDFYTFDGDDLAGAASAAGPATREPASEPPSPDAVFADPMDDFAADAPVPPPPPMLGNEAVAAGEDSAAADFDETVMAADDDSDVAEEFAELPVGSVDGEPEPEAVAEADAEAVGEAMAALVSAENMQPLAPPSLDVDAPAITAADIANRDVDEAPEPEIAATGAEPESEPEADVAAGPEENPEPEARTPVDEPSAEDGLAEAEPAPADEHYEYADSFALKSGDELAADLFEEEMRDALSVVDSWHRAGAENYGVAVDGPAPASPVEAAAAAPAAPVPAPEPVRVRPDVLQVARIVTAVTGAALRPGMALMPPPEAEVVSDAIDSAAVEQPRPVHMVDMVAAAASAIRPAPDAGANAAAGGVKVLFLPYHDRENPNNLIRNTGGGEVVTALFGARLAMEKGVQVLWPDGWFTSHGRLPSVDEALQIGRLSGVDYVVRGQVVEFRRAQSVPSFYSAVISTAVLAAQMVFAETSGVDVATEVFRVSDGKCVLARRDRSLQKYVVQAEKTVRKLAVGAAPAVSAAILNPPEQAAAPIIDDLQPMTLLGNIL